MVKLAKDRTAPAQECVGDDISFTILASEHDTLSGNVELIFQLFMAWPWAERAVNVCATFHSINSCYMYVRERT